MHLYPFFSSITDMFATKKHIVKSNTTKVLNDVAAFVFVAASAVIIIVIIVNEDNIHDNSNGNILHNINKLMKMRMILVHIKMIMNIDFNNTDNTC
jgi:hypothetical protein